MKTAILFIFGIFLVNGCASYTNKISDNENAWITVQDGMIRPKFFYCMAKKSADSTKAEPTCYHAEYVEQKP